MGSKKIFPISLLFVHKSENSLVHVHCLCSVLWALNFYLKSNGATRQVRYAYIRSPFFTSRCAAIISMHLFSYRENATPIWVPYIGQKFRNLEDAWSFWVDYGGHAGFEVRKRYTNESKCDKRVTSCRYVCAKEGCRARDRRDHVTKNPRAETRTYCPLRMGITLEIEWQGIMKCLIWFFNTIMCFTCHKPLNISLLFSNCSFAFAGSYWILWSGRSRSFFNLWFSSCYHIWNISVFWDDCWAPVC